MNEHVLMNTCFLQTKDKNYWKLMVLWSWNTTCGGCIQVKSLEYHYWQNDDVPLICHRVWKNCVPTAPTCNHQLANRTLYNILCTESDSNLENKFHDRYFTTKSNQPVLFKALYRKQSVFCCGCVYCCCFFFSNSVK